MIKRAEDRITEIREQMRGGKGKVEITHIFTNEEFKGKARLCAQITLEPGCSIGLHEHVNEDEIFYFIKGEGRVIDNGKEYFIKAGDSLLTGGGDSHSVENTGCELLVFVAIILLYQ